MAHYANQINLAVAEIATLEFNHVINNKPTVVGTVVIPLEALRNLHTLMGSALKEFEANQKKAIEQSNKMN